MPKARKILLLHERRETWRVKLGRKRRAICEQCQEEVTWLTCSEAALVANLTEREIFRLTESGEIHASETESGRLLICDYSLASACQRK